MDFQVSPEFLRKNDRLSKQVENGLTKIFIRMSSNNSRWLLSKVKSLIQKENSTYRTINFVNIIQLDLN